MDPLKLEFQSAANQLFDVDFKGGKKSLIIEVSGDNPDPRLPSSGDTVYNTDAIPLQLEQAAKIFQGVNADSVYISTRRYDYLPIEVTPDMPVNFNGKSYRIAAIDTDAYDVLYNLELVSG